MHSRLNIEESLWQTERRYNSSRLIWSLLVRGWGGKHQRKGERRRPPRTGRPEKKAPQGRGGWGGVCVLGGGERWENKAVIKRPRMKNRAGLRMEVKEKRGVKRETRSWIQLHLLPSWPRVSWTYWTHEINIWNNNCTIQHSSIKILPHWFMKGRHGGVAVCTFASQQEGSVFDSCLSVSSFHLLHVSVWVFSGYSSFLPQSEHMHRRLNTLFIAHKWECDCQMIVCVCMFVHVIRWDLSRVHPVSCPMSAGFSASLHHNPQRIDNGRMDG